MSSAKGSRRAWWKWALVIVLALLVLPILQVGCVRFIDPPATPPMLLSDTFAKLHGSKQNWHRYHWIDFEKMPRRFLRCVIASEDQRFFQHHGFDWKEVEIARRQAAKTGREPRGASTISMQCARSLFLWQGRSWIRKGLECYYTFWMETLLPKRRILELYANVIEMGDGVYGIEAAARELFGKAAAALTVEECAMLAAILPAPRERDPRTPSIAMKTRAARILQRESSLRTSIPR